MTSLFGQPTAYFDPPRGPLTFDATYSYSSFTSPTAIPFSATPSFIGLEAVGADGTHFGYAEFSGTELLSYASETVPGVGIIPAGAPVPEPATLALLATGLVGLGLGRRRGR